MLLALLALGCCDCEFHAAELVFPVSGVEWSVGTSLWVRELGVEVVLREDESGVEVPVELVGEWGSFSQLRPLELLQPGVRYRWDLIREGESASWGFGVTADPSEEDTQPPAETELTGVREVSEGSRFGCCSVFEQVFVADLESFPEGADFFDVEVRSGEEVLGDLAMERGPRFAAQNGRSWELRARAVDYSGNTGGWSQWHLVE